MSTEQTKVAALELVTVAPSGVNPILQKMALSRFETTFKLEGELVGKGKVRVSKKGAVTLSLKSVSAKDGSGLDMASGLKGDALEAYRQKLAGQLKTEFGVMATRLSADTRYEAGKAVIAPSGAVTLEWKPVKDETIVVVSEKSAMAALGISEDELAAIQLAREEKANAEAKAKKDAEEKAAADKAKVEQAAAEANIAAEAAKNGEVNKAEDEAPEDTKSMTE